MEILKNRILVETEYKGANVSCIKTQKGAVLIDSPFLKKDAEDWARSIREKMDQDIAFLINTDHHFDHVLGNMYLTDRIISHSTAAKGIKFLEDKQQLKMIIQGMVAELPPEIEVEMDALVIPSPFITFDHNLTLTMGDATIVVEFVGGHSPGTVLIYVPEYKIVFTGDNIEAQFPYFGQGRFYGWKKLLERILTMDIDTVVPGHGPVGGKDMVEKYLAFFQGLEDEVKKFDLNGINADQMPKESKMLDFFSMEEAAKEGIPRAYWEMQYMIAAKQILSSPK